MPTIKGRVPFDDLPSPVRRAILALETSLHHHTNFTAAQITFDELITPNEYVKPTIDTRSYDAPVPSPSPTKVPE